MAFQSSDGKSFTNRPPMMAHERSVNRGMADRTDPLGQPNGGGDDAAEHGPAVEVNVMHDHENGKHSVHSKHPDGHEAQSEHGSAEEAHEHAAKMAGCGTEHEPEDDAEFE